MVHTFSSHNFRVRSIPMNLFASTIAGFAFASAAFAAVGQGAFDRTIQILGPS